MNTGVGRPSSSEVGGKSWGISSPPPRAVECVPWCPHDQGPALARRDGASGKVAFPAVARGRGAERRGYSGESSPRSPSAPCGSPWRRGHTSMCDQALSGAVALVTGATSVVGAATARRLAREGVAIGLVARQQQRLDEFPLDLSEAGLVATKIEADISDPDKAVEAVEVVVDRFTRLD